MEGDSAGPDKELRNKLKIFIAEIDKIVTSKRYPLEATSPQGRSLILPNGLRLNLTYNKGRPCGFKLEGEGKAPLLLAGDFPGYKDSHPEMPCVEVRGMYIKGTENVTLVFQAEEDKRATLLLDGKVNSEFTDRTLVACKEWISGKDVESVRRKYFPEGVPKTALEETRDELCRKFLEFLKRLRRSS